MFGWYSDILTQTFKLCMYTVLRWQTIQTLENSNACQVILGLYSRRRPWPPRPLALKLSINKPVSSHCWIMGLKYNSQLNIWIECKVADETSSERKANCLHEKSSVKNDSLSFCESADVAKHCVSSKRDLSRPKVNCQHFGWKLRCRRLWDLTYIANISLLRPR